MGVTAAEAIPGFQGFGPQAVAWFEGLEADNSRDYFERTRDAWEREVRGPLVALLTEAAAEEGTVKLFRQNRDIRFSKDKAPYKTTAYGVVLRPGTEAGWYAEMSSRGLFVGTGYYQMAQDQLQRFRAAVDKDSSGPMLTRLAEAAGGAGVRIGGEAVATAPRGFAKDHPRIRFLRLKDLIVGRQFGPGPLLQQHRILDEARKVWGMAAPLCAWLDKHVGASEIPPEIRWGRGG
jgi:uncharacterized protein (TIGR02453 family)